MYTYMLYQPSASFPQPDPSPNRRDHPDRDHQEVEEIGEQAKQEAKMEATIAKLQRCLEWTMNGPWMRGKQKGKQAMDIKPWASRI